MKLTIMLIVAILVVVVVAVLFIGPKRVGRRIEIKQENVQNAFDKETKEAASNEVLEKRAERQYLQHKEQQAAATGVVYSFRQQLSKKERELNELNELFKTVEDITKEAMLALRSGSLTIKNVTFKNAEHLKDHIERFSNDHTALETKRTAIARKIDSLRETIDRGEMEIESQKIAAERFRTTLEESKLEEQILKLQKSLRTLCNFTFNEFDESPLEELQRRHAIERARMEGDRPTVSYETEKILRAAKQDETIKKLEQKFGLEPQTESPTK